MKKIFIVIMTVLLAAAMAACSGGGAVKPQDSGSKSESPSEASEPADVEASTAPEVGVIIEPEQLISQDAAAALMGDVKDGEKREQPAVGQKLIVYNTTGGDNFLQISLNQLAFMSVEGSTPESIYMTTKDAVASENAETVEGVGDEYFFGTPGLHILYRGYYIVLAAGGSDSPEVRKLLKDAGAKAVANLGALLG